MIVFIPPPDTQDAALLQHNAAYRTLISTAGVEVSDNINIPAYACISEREPWDFYTKFFELHGMYNLPIELCDKSTNQYWFSKVGMPTLPTYIFDNISLLSKFKNTPLIFKPLLSGGGVSSTPFAYKVFDNSKELVNWCISNNLDQLLCNIPRDSKALIIQESVATYDERYGQLHVEGVVNGSGNIYFSSSHEVEFTNGSWTKQLPYYEEDSIQIHTIKQRIQELVHIKKIKNCMFTLQHVRNFTDKIWYPTDWQYRLSYNTIFGRANAEPEHTNDLVKYMLDIKTSVVPSTKHYYQKYIKNSNKVLPDNIKVIPTQKDSSMVLLISNGGTFKQAEESMNNYLGKYSVST